MTRLMPRPPRVLGATPALAPGAGGTKIGQACATSDDLGARAALAPGTDGTEFGKSGLDG